MRLSDEVADMCFCLDRNLAPELERIALQIERFGTVPLPEARLLVRSTGRLSRSVKKLSRKIMQCTRLKVEFGPQCNKKRSYDDRRTYTGHEVFVGGEFHGFIGHDYRAGLRIHYYWNLTRKGNIGVNHQSRDMGHRYNEMEPAKKKLIQHLHNIYIGQLFSED